MQKRSRVAHRGLKPRRPAQGAGGAGVVAVDPRGVAPVGRPRHPPRRQLHLELPDVPPLRAAVRHVHRSQLRRRERRVAHRQHRRLALRRRRHRPGREEHAVLAVDPDREAVRRLPLEHPPARREPQRDHVRPRRARRRQRQRQRRRRLPRELQRRLHPAHPERDPPPHVVVELRQPPHHVLPALLHLQPLQQPRVVRLRRHHHLHHLRRGQRAPGRHKLHLLPHHRPRELAGRVRRPVLVLQHHRERPLAALVRARVSRLRPHLHLVRPLRRTRRQRRQRRHTGRLRRDPEVRLRLRLLAVPVHPRPRLAALRRHAPPLPRLPAERHLQAGDAPPVRVRRRQLHPHQVRPVPGHVERQHELPAVRLAHRRRRV
eukprot:Rhum_TRINITY_DN14681_c4_g1::Rhum_TRINITY_DN14681_c4_g1_i2::g.109726::m.109726